MRVPPPLIWELFNPLANIDALVAVHDTYKTPLMLRDIRVGNLSCT